MAKRLNLKVLEAMHYFDARIDEYIDGNGYVSLMRWIPPFRACRALNSTGQVATPSNTIGDWFHPLDVQAAWVENTDYEILDMGGFWADMYLCSSPDASQSSMGTVADGIAVDNYISQPGVAPRVSQTIAHFKTYLAARFSTGGFSGQTTATGWAGKGGLMTDQHWFEMWIWTRINRWLLRGNTAGYDGVNPSTPVWHGDSGEIGAIDGAQSNTYGANITGGGAKAWDIPVSDFCGNRWEFTDGLRLYDGVIYTAGKTIDPPDDYSDAAYTNTALSISGVTSGYSVATYRAESAIRLHGIAASTITAGTGPFDGAGFWYDATLERIARRGGACPDGARCPGALSVSLAPAVSSWNIGARAVLVP